LVYDATQEDETTRFSVGNVSDALKASLSNNTLLFQWVLDYITHAGLQKFTLSSTGNATYTLRGPWVACLGLNPMVSNILSSSSSLECELQVNGLKFMNLNSSIGRSVMATQTTDMRLTPSDIIWTIPLPGVPLEPCYYTNFSSGGKVPCTMAVIETLEIYFTDKYNFGVMGLTDWTVVLTFDYMEREKPAQPVTSKDVRQFINSY
jgi:hypothetical protein